MSATLLGAPAASAATSGALMGAGSGRCMDISGATTANVAPVVLWNCTGQSNHQWAFKGDRAADCNVATVDPNAAKQARHVLCSLYSQYGNHIVSGQQEPNGSESGFNSTRGVVDSTIPTALHENAPSPTRLNSSPPAPAGSCSAHGSPARTPASSGPP